MELISKQSKDVMGQELVVKISVADLVILESVLGYQSDDDLFESLHYSSTTCQKNTWGIYNGDQGLFEYMKRNPDNHFSNTYQKLNQLLNMYLLLRIHIK